MEKIEIIAPEPQKALLVLREAIERHKQLLAQSVARTHERIQQLAAQLRVDQIFSWPGKCRIQKNRTWTCLSWKGSWPFFATCVIR